MRLSTWCTALLCVLGEYALAGSVLSTCAEAQDAGLVTLRGVTFDSLTGKPLATATVRIIGRAEVTVSDSKGRFKVDSLPTGPLLLVMEHERLDSIGLNEIVARVTVSSKQRDVQISIPSFNTLWRAACGTARVPGDSGFMYGAIRNPDHEEGVPNAHVAVSWIDVRLGDAKKLRQTRYTLDTRTDSTGSYAACGVPIDVPLQMVARADSASEISVELPARNSRVLRRDILLGAAVTSTTTDSVAGSVIGGTGVVRGKVTNMTGQPVENVRVGIDGVELARTNSEGEFIARGIRAGTRTVAFVSIGSEPVMRIVDVPVDGIATASVSMERATVLENIVVRGARATRLVRDFEARKRSGFGSIKDSTELSRYPSLESALRMSRGVTIDSRSHSIYLPTSKGQLCTPTIFLDKVRVDQELLLSVFPSDLAWTEVYPRWYDVPMEFQIGGTCGVVAIFTKWAIERR